MNNFIKVEIFYLAKFISRIKCLLKMVCKSLSIHAAKKKASNSYQHKHFRDFPLKILINFLKVHYSIGCIKITYSRIYIETFFFIILVLNCFDLERMNDLHTQARRHKCTSSKFHGFPILFNVSLIFHNVSPIFKFFQARKCERCGSLNPRLIPPSYFYFRFINHILMKQDI